MYEHFPEQDVCHIAHHGHGDRNYSGDLYIMCGVSVEDHNQDIVDYDKQRSEHDSLETDTTITLDQYGKEGYRDKTVHPYH